MNVRRWGVTMVVVLLALGTGCKKATGPTPAGPSGPAAGAAPGGTAASDWPCFHGPKGDNLSAETGLLKQWPDGGPPLLWTAKGLGHGFSSVAIAGGRIYTAGNVGEDSAVTALDRDGKTLWQTPVGPAWTRDHPGTRGTPAIDGDRVYFESPLGDVACLDAKTGDKQWGVNLLREFDGRNITWALSESLRIDGDRVICCPGGRKASVAALDKRSGKTVWAAPSTNENAGYAAPALAEHQGLRLVLAMNQKAFLGVNADNGDLLWRHDHPTQHDVNATTPVFHQGQAFITSGYGAGSEMLQVRVEGKKASVERVWESRDLDNHHGGVVRIDDHLYGAAHGGPWVCLEWKTGKRVYTERGVGKGSLTVAEGMLYTLSENREMGLVPATPAGHKPVSRFKVPSGGDGPSWAHPVVCGGRLYLRHSDRLFAYDLRAR